MGIEGVDEKGHKEREEGKNEHFRIKMYVL